MPLNTYDFIKATYSVSEAMQHLCIGRTKLYELVKQGRLKPVKLGKKTLFSATELARFLTTLETAV